LKTRYYHFMVIRAAKHILLCFVDPYFIEKNKS